MKYFTKNKFLSFNSKWQHKKAAEFLRNGFYHRENFSYYIEICHWLELELIPFEQKKHLSDRYHYHLGIAKIRLKEHNLLPTVTKLDKPSLSPYLPIDIYLDNLRSAYNIGSIIRTNEALRLGTIHLPTTIDEQQKCSIQKCAMNTFNEDLVKYPSSITALKKPLIAVETSTHATSLYNFTFPNEFSLLFGNEEYGLSSTSLSQADQIIQIPLLGAKNSLNVACCFAIIAAQIRKKNHLLNYISD